MIITGGKYRGRRITAPDEHIARPTLSQVRMGVFNVLYSLSGDFEGKTFLDMFGGSGIMGLEALSRGFSKTVIFEKNPKAAQIIRKNYEALGLTPDLKTGDSLKLIERTADIFDVVYADPPYLCGIYTKMFSALKGKAKIVIAEHSEDIVTDKFALIKTKNYGGKRISFYMD